MASYDPNEVPEWVSKAPTELEPGTYQVLVSEADDTDDKQGRPQVAFKLIVTEPPLYKNRVLYERFNLWVPFSLSKYGAFLKAAGIQPTGSTTDDGQMVLGTSVLVRVYHEGATKKDGSANPYAGKPKIGEFFALGAREVGVKGAVSAPVAPRSTKPTEDE